MRELGFQHVTVVPQQELPDGNFPTVAYPNPEDPNAFALALRLAEETGADIVLATDPDADRLGVYAKDTATGKYMPFTGNMSGLLIAEYEISQKAALGLLPKRREDGALVTTVVSSNMSSDICGFYGLTRIETLTGFKYIGEQIERFGRAREKNGGELCAAAGAYEFLFGYEESYGCLVGTHARDKAVVAVMKLCEAAAYYRTQGLTLWDQMLRMYEKYGYYKELLSFLTLRGEDGARQIAAMMEKLRGNPPERLAGSAVLALRDYQNGIRRDLVTGEVSKTGLPESNVLYYELEDNGWCCVRPSGTEPKIKFYFGAKGTSMEDADAKANAIKEELLAFMGA